jgi:hypothetical protein
MLPGRVTLSSISRFLLRSFSSANGHLHSVSLFQVHTGPAVSFLLRLLCDLSPGMRYEFSDISSSDLLDRDTGASGSYCTIPWSAGIGFAHSSVGWSCRLTFVVALVHNICGAHLANCAYCLFLLYARGIDGCRFSRSLNILHETIRFWFSIFFLHNSITTHGPGYLEPFRAPLDD